MIRAAGTPRYRAHDGAPIEPPLRPGPLRK